MSKQSRRCTSMSCWHCNACMIICWTGIALAGRCTQSGTYQWGLTKNIQVKHDLRSRLWGGQGQHKIGGAHLGHVGIAINACMIICWKGIAFAGRCTQSGTCVPLKRDSWTDGRKDGRTEGFRDGQPGNIMSRRSYRAGHKNLTKA